VLDSEWAVPVTYKNPDGLKDASNVFRHMIQRTADFLKEKKYPVSLFTEMRFSRASSLPLSPYYHPQTSEKDSHIGFASPEFITHSPNPYWEEFYSQLHSELTSDQRFSNNVKFHLAKQFCSVFDHKRKIGMMQYLRERLNDPILCKYPNEIHNTCFKVWKAARDQIDESKLFVNPFIHQLFYSENQVYVPPTNFTLSEKGGLS